ncbi:MAG: nicotinate-nucleotide adenylyltransferase [Salinarimonas sp.]
MSSARMLPPILPPAGDGQRIGLFGGSFNPPHAGHRHVTLMALRRLRLDAVWWLVTPGNPLKAGREIAPIRERMEAARAYAAHPRITVSDVEAQAGLRYTVDTLNYLKQRRPDLAFVWIMGADGLTHFHRWRDWRDIARAMPICVVDRPGHSRAATASLAGQALARYRLPEAAAPVLAGALPPAWIFLHGPRLPISSTQIRTSRATGT